MVINFSCDQCTQRYAVGEELAGKRTKCKKCGKILSIPVPKGVVPASAKPAPAKPAPEPADDRFGLADSPDFLPDDEVPVAKVIGRGGSSKRSTQKSSGMDDPTTRYAVFGGGGVIGLVLLVAVIVAATRKKAEPAIAAAAVESPALKAHRKALDEGIEALSELSDAVSPIRDEASAERYAPKVREALFRIQALSDRAAGLGRLSPSEKRALAAEAGRKRGLPMERLRDELKRIRETPEASERLAPLAGMIRLPD